MENLSRDFEEAKRSIAECKETGAVELNLSELSIDRLPEEICSLTSLTNVSLSRCENLTDVSGLSGLTSLTSVDLFGCGSLTDVSVLSGLTSLTSVNLTWCRNLTDVSVLSGLTSLTSVSLSLCRNLTDVSVLSGLTSLTSVYLTWCENLADVSGLSGLTSLTSLDLSRCKNLNNVSGLSNLPSLTSLDLSRCENLTDVSGLSGLTSLTSVDLSGCENLTDVSGLSNLPSLTSLDLSRCENLTDVSGLSGLTSLTSVNLSECNNLTDVSVLSGLTSLTSVDLSGCYNLTDVSGLSGLTSLTSLRLSECRDLYIRNLIENLPSLGSLILYGGKFKDLMSEFCGSEYGENVLEQVRSHFESIDEQGDSTYSEAKIIILGDAGCGKTSFVKALKGYDHNEKEETTYAINLWDLSKDLNVSPFGSGDGYEVTKVNVWDFGGQTVYHSAHQLFLVSRAVYVIVFKRLKSGETGREKLPYCEPRGVRYWVNMVCSIAPDVPLIIVRTHTDMDDVYAKTSDERWVEKYAEQNRDVKYVKLSCRLRNDIDLPEFKKDLGDDICWVFEGGQKKYAVANGWADVREELEKIKTTQRWITFDQYCLIVERLFGAKEYAIPDRNRLLNLLQFFHNYGALFCPKNWRTHDGKHFYVVLDQAWFINAIYQPFIHNDEVNSNWYHHIMLEKGVLPKKKLHDILLSDEVESEGAPMEVLFDMMLSCNLAVRVSGRKDIESLYVLPDFLADRKKSKFRDDNLRKWKYGKHSVRYTHDEWGSAFARRMVCTCINKFGSAIERWKYGAEVDVDLGGQTTTVWVEWCPPTNKSQRYNGDLILECRGNVDRRRRHRIYKYLIDLLADRHSGGIRRVPKLYRRILEQYFKWKPDPALDCSTRDNKIVEADVIKEKARPSKKDLRIGFSVAGQDPKGSGDESLPWNLFKELKVFEQDKGFNVFYYRRDLGMTNLNQLMSELSQSQLVVFFITPKFLKSDYCMTELLMALTHCMDLKEADLSELNWVGYVKSQGNVIPKNLMFLPSAEGRSLLNEYGDLSRSWIANTKKKVRKLEDEGKTLHQALESLKNESHGEWYSYVHSVKNQETLESLFQMLKSTVVPSHDLEWPDTIDEKSLKAPTDYLLQRIAEL